MRNWRPRSAGTWRGCAGRWRRWRGRASSGVRSGGPFRLTQRRKEAKGPARFPKVPSFRDNPEPKPAEDRSSFPFGSGRDPGIQPGSRQKTPCLLRHCVPVFSSFVKSCSCRGPCGVQEDAPRYSTTRVPGAGAGGASPLAEPAPSGCASALLVAGALKMTMTTPMSSSRAAR